MSKSRRIPERWENYKPLGRCIAGTRLMAFKVPLKRALCDNLPPDLRFTPGDLVEWTRDLKRPIGLVVDLTNTSRYYNSQEFQQAGIEYKKMFTEGHVVPNDRIVEGFVTIVNEFLSRHSNDELLVGVHCTHGVNRTGYLVCRYLIETLNWTATRALKAFAEARGHQVERPNYIADLQKICAARQASKSANGQVKHMEESATQPGQRSRQNSGSNAGCRRRTASGDKCNVLGIDSRGIDPGRSKILDPETQRYRSNPHTKELNSVVFEDASRIDGCQSTHKRCFEESYWPKNTPDSGRQMVHETHFNSRTGGQYHRQQNSGRGHLHNDCNSEIRGRGAFTTCRSTPIGQPAWTGFYPYPNYQQPTQYYYSAASNNGSNLFDPSGTQFQQPKAKRCRMNLQMEGEINSVVSEGATRFDGCQPIHETFWDQSYRLKNTPQASDRQIVPNSHFNSWTRGQYYQQQQNPRHNHSSEVGGRGAFPACHGRPTDQSPWASFHGYQTYRQPMQYNEYSNRQPVSVKRNEGFNGPGHF